jgi:hypothetical protein
VAGLSLSRNGFVDRAEDPMRTLSEMIGERIAAAMAGRPAAAVMALRAAK